MVAFYTLVTCFLFSLVYLREYHMFNFFRAFTLFSIYLFPCFILQLFPRLTLGTCFPLFRPFFTRVTHSCFSRALQQLGDFYFIFPRFSPVRCFCFSRALHKSRVLFQVTRLQPVCCPFVFLSLEIILR